MPVRIARELVRVWLVFGLVIAVGCSRGPDTDTLQGELQRRLDEHFEDGLFRIEGFRRMGSAPYRAEGAEKSGLLVYFSTQLVLERDYSLTAWKGLNLGTLSFVMGANESGIDGFSPRGNAEGDVLHANGRLHFQHEKDGWVPADDAPSPTSEPVSAHADLRGSGPDALMQGVRDLLARSPKAERDTKDAVIVKEMRRAVSRIDLGVARLDGKLTFGSGPAPGTYHAFGAALREFAERMNLPIYSYPSEGSMENGSRLQAGTLDFGLVQSDVAELLYEGWAEEGIFPNRDLRAVASLWPEAVHIVTLEKTGIRSIADLRNRRVAIGQRGSGTRFNAVQIGLAAGIEAGEVPQIREIGLAEGLDALDAGRVDAIFVTEGIPSKALQAFAASRTDVRFVSIDHQVVRDLSNEHFAYYPLTVEARTYPNQKEAFDTLGLASVLVTSRHVADASVERLLELIVDGADELARRYYRAAFVSRETMRLGIAVPLHRAAAQFYAQREEDEAATAASTEDEPAHAP